MDDDRYESADDLKPYMFEPMPNENTEWQFGVRYWQFACKWRQSWWRIWSNKSLALSTLEWCKCGYCDMSKTIESFCCHEKSIEYDEYDDKVKSAQDQGFTCITKLSSFEQNISRDVLEVDIMQYVEDNWLLDDEDIARMHKLFRLVGYRRCSR